MMIAPSQRLFAMSVINMLAPLRLHGIILLAPKTVDAHIMISFCHHYARILQSCFYHLLFSRRINRLPSPVLSLILAVASWSPVADNPHHQPHGALLMFQHFKKTASRATGFRLPAVRIDPLHGILTLTLSVAGAALLISENPLPACIVLAVTLVNAALAIRRNR